MNLAGSDRTLSVFKHFADDSSQILSVLSSDADTRSLESELQATSDIPNLCPETVFSNLPS